MMRKVEPAAVSCSTAIVNLSVGLKGTYLQQNGAGGRRSRSVCDQSLALHVHSRDSQRRAAARALAQVKRQQLSNYDMAV